MSNKNLKSFKPAMWLAFTSFILLYTSLELYGLKPAIFITASVFAIGIIIRFSIRLFKSRKH